MKTLYFIFINSDQLLLRREEWSVPTEQPEGIVMDGDIHRITFNGNNNIYTFRAKDFPDEDEYITCGLRDSYNHLPKEHYLMAGKCREILHWDATSQYCPCCGSKTRKDTDISKKCPKCGHEQWPQLQTAVICLVRRGDEALLVRAKNFKRDYYGLVAGFVETGETLEDAVKREVMEETGISISNISYFASQPWPYPCGLMVGFYADYESGNIILQETEIARAGWFTWDNLPAIPAKLSIARQLIDNWVKGKMKI